MLTSGEGRGERASLDASDESTSAAGLAKRYLARGAAQLPFFELLAHRRLVAAVRRQVPFFDQRAHVGECSEPRDGRDEWSRSQPSKERCAAHTNHDSLRTDRKLQLSKHQGLFFKRNSFVFDFRMFCVPSGSCLIDDLFVFAA